MSTIFILSMRAVTRVHLLLAHAHLDLARVKLPRTINIHQYFLIQHKYIPRQAIPLSTLGLLLCSRSNAPEQSTREYEETRPLEGRGNQVYKQRTLEVASQTGFEAARDNVQPNQDEDSNRMWLGGGVCMHLQGVHCGPELALGGETGLFNIWPWFSSTPHNSPT